MNNNLKLILDEFGQLKGQFIITCSHKIERLINIGDDGEDYYWFTFDGRKFNWNTCVGKIIPLKGYLRDEDYNEFIRLAKLNHFDFILGQEEFDKYFKNYLDSLSSNHKFHNEHCFELN